MLPFKFRVKNPQHLPEHLLCTYRVSMCFEAIAELPRAVVERRVSPAKHLDLGNQVFCS